MSSDFTIILSFLMSYLNLHQPNTRSWSIEFLAQPSLHLSHWILHCVCYAALSDLTNRNWAIVCCLVSFNSDALFVYLSAGYRKEQLPVSLPSFLPSCRMSAIVLSIGRCRRLKTNRQICFGFIVPILNVTSLSSQYIRNVVCLSNLLV